MAQQGHGFPAVVKTTARRPALDRNMIERKKGRGFGSRWLTNGTSWLGGAGHCKMEAMGPAMALYCLERNMKVVVVPFTESSIAAKLGDEDDARLKAEAWPAWSSVA